MVHTRRVIEQLHEEISSRKIERPSLQSFAESWLDAKKPEVAHRTIVFYAAAINKLIEFLGPRADAPLSEITKGDLVAFRNATASRTTAKTANHCLKAVRMLFLAARRDRVLSENPAEFVERLRERGEGRTRQFKLRISASSGGTETVRRLNLMQKAGGLTTPLKARWLLKMNDLCARGPLFVQQSALGYGNSVSLVTFNAATWNNRNLELKPRVLQFSLHHSSPRSGSNPGPK